MNRVQRFLEQRALRLHRSIPVLVGAFLGAFVLFAVHHEGRMPALAFLAACAVVGEVLVLYLEDGNYVPLSYAMFLVFGAAFSVGPALLAVVVVCAVGVATRYRPDTVQLRVREGVHHAVVGAVMVLVTPAAEALAGSGETLPVVLWSLIAGACAGWLADGWLRTRRGLGHLSTFRGRRAWVVIASSGMLMALADRGVGGTGDLGPWGPVLFSIPLVAAWHSFSRLDAAERVQRQTIEALAMAPEHAGRSPRGRAALVAEWCSAVGEHLGFDDDELEALESAALLQRLGIVTLDDPAFGAEEPPAATVALVTADMLRAIGPLARAGDIVARAGSRRSVTYLDARGNAAALVLQFAGTLVDECDATNASPSEVLSTLRSTIRDDEELRTLAAFDAVAAG